MPVRVGLRSTLRRRLISLTVLLGAATTIVMALAVQAAASLLERFLPGSAPGLQAISAILLWIYYEAQILLAGVQLSRVLAERRTNATGD